MILGDRLKALRVEKHFSQRDVEQRTGLLRCYVSRVENGYTVPSIQTLEKMAQALEVPLYRLFYDGEQILNASTWIKEEEPVWGRSGRSASDLHKLRQFLQEMKDSERGLLLSVAKMMASRNRRNR